MSENLVELFSRGRPARWEEITTLVWPIGGHKIGQRESSEQSKVEDGEVAGIDKSAKRDIQDISKYSTSQALGQ